MIHSLVLQKSRTSSKNSENDHRTSPDILLPLFTSFEGNLFKEYEYYYFRQTYSLYLPPFNLSFFIGFTFFVVKRHELTVHLETVNNGSKPLFA